MEQTDITILEAYKEKTIKRHPDYSHMLKFETPSISSYYYMDSNDKFWFTQAFLDNFGELSSNKEERIQKYLDIDNNQQELFIKFDSTDELFSSLDEHISEEASDSTEQATWRELKSLLNIIVSNKRWGAPRKSITVGKQSFNIQFPEDKTEQPLILQPKLEL